MTSEEKEYVSELGAWFYGSAPNSVNERLADVLAIMLHETLEASRRLDMVPRPAGMKPGLAWLVKEAVLGFWRAEQGQGVYEMAKQTVALKWRTEYTMAEMGL